MVNKAANPAYRRSSRAMMQNRQRQYPWDEWTNGEEWVVNPQEHYGLTIKKFDNDLRVRMRILNQRVLELEETEAWQVRTSVVGLEPGEVAFIFYRIPVEELPASQRDPRRKNDRYKPTRAPAAVIDYFACKAEGGLGMGHEPGSSPRLCSVCKKMEDALKTPEELAAAQTPQPQQQPQQPQQPKPAAPPLVGQDSSLIDSILAETGYTPVYEQESVQVDGLLIPGPVTSPDPTAPPYEGPTASIYGHLDPGRHYEEVTAYADNGEQPDLSGTYEVTTATDEETGQEHVAFVPTEDPRIAQAYEQEGQWPTAEETTFHDRGPVFRAPTPPSFDAWKAQQG